MRLLRQTEYETLQSVKLSSEEAATLAAYRPCILVTPAGGAGKYDITATHWIGAIQVSDSLALEIHPKVPIERVMFMVGYAADSEAWQPEPFAYGTDPSLLEAIVPGFLHQVRRAVCRGLLQGYRRRKDALHVVRGRLRLDEQLRRHHGRYPPIEVEFDDFTEDIDENRLLRAAIARLGALRINSPAARAALRHYAAVFQNVSLVEYAPPDIPVMHYTRLNRHYRGALELARLILQSISLRHEWGNVGSSAFLLDMNRLFEDFVRTALREALGVDERAFPRAASGHALRLDRGRTVALEPDLSWWRGGRCVFVGDAKYKDLAVQAVPNPDLYQMLAYTTAVGLTTGLLIYPGTENAAVEYEVVNGGPVIDVRTIDLDRPPAAVLMQIGSLAQAIREITADAVHAKPPEDAVASVSEPVAIMQ